MHKTHTYDDQSVCKNEWIVRQAQKGVRLSFAVFREVGPAVWSPNTHRHFDPIEHNRLFQYPDGHSEEL